jgi:hypothetical protein
MLLSNKWNSNLSGSIQLDLPYTTIPTCEGTFVTSYKEPLGRYHVEYSKEPMNQLVHTEEDEFGNYFILTHSMAPEVKEEYEERINILENAF